MKCYKDTTFCVSPNCTNECGRKLPEDEVKNVPYWVPISIAYFCGIPEEQKKDDK
jgi:hypothetical protein